MHMHFTGSLAENSAQFANADLTLSLSKLLLQFTLTKNDFTADLHLYVIHGAQLLTIHHSAICAVEVCDAHLVVLCMQQASVATTYTHNT